MIQKNGGELYCKSDKKVAFFCLDDLCEKNAFQCYCCPTCQQTHIKCTFHERVKIYEDKRSTQIQKDPERLLSRTQRQNLPLDWIERFIKKFQQIQRKQRESDNKFRGLGLNEMNKNILFEGGSKLTTPNMKHFLENGMNFTDKQYLIPPQFAKQSRDLMMKIQIWQRRKAQYFKIYRLLARIDVHLKDNKYQQLRNFSKKSFEQVHKEVQKLNKFLNEAINIRIKLAEQEESYPITQGQIKHFKHISEKLRDVACNLTILCHNYRMYPQNERYYEIYCDYFSEWRKELRLKDQDRVQAMKRIQAQLKILNNQYQEPFQYFRNNESKDDVLVLEVLVNLCQKLNKQQQQLEYLKLWQVQEPKNLQLLQNILNILEKRRQNELCLQYLSKIILLLEQGENVDKQGLFNVYKKNALVKWQQKQIAQALMNYQKALKICTQQFNNDDPKWALYYCEIRQLISYQYFVNSTENRKEELRMMLKNTIIRCQYFIQQINDEQYKQEIQKYYVRFLTRMSYVASPNDKAIQYLQKAIQVAQSIHYKFFQPYLQLIRKSYKSRQLQLTKNTLHKSFHIYPHFQCYHVQAVILFKQSHLPDAIQSLNKSILLKQSYTPSYYLRGRCYFKLKKYRSAKNDFENVIEKGQKTAQVYSELAQSIQLLQEVNYVQNCQHYYEKSLEINPNIERSILGLGRVLKEQGEIELAKHYFQKLVNKNGKFKNFGNMYLGNIYEEKGKKDAKRQEQWYEKALQFYEKADRQHKNIENLTRILISLGRGKSAQRILKQVND